MKLRILKIEVRKLNLYLKKLDTNYKIQIVLKTNLSKLSTWTRKKPKKLPSQNINKKIITKKHKSICANPKRIKTRTQQTPNRHPLSPNPTFQPVWTLTSTRQSCTGSSPNRTHSTPPRRSPAKAVRPTTPAITPHSNSSRINPCLRLNWIARIHLRVNCHRI